MSTRRVLAVAGLAGLSIIGLVIAVYYVPYTNFKVLNAEIDVERWAAVIKSSGGGGRDCFYVDYDSLAQTLRELNRKPVRKRPGELMDLPIHCLNKLHLAEMRYSAQDNVVSGIYRCEDKDMLQELQLAVYLKPKSMPYDDYCMIGSFMKSWNVPVGAATGYP